MESLVAVVLVAVGLWLLVVLILVVAGRRLAARELAFFAPNAALLFTRLLRDPLVPRRAKLLLGLGVAYLAMPIDLVPDFVPIAGQLDDVIVAVLLLRQVTRWTGRERVIEHWPGERSTIDRVLRLAGVSR